MAVETETAGAPVSKWTFVRRAWRGRCPQCGEGALFLSFARIRERCPHCDLVYRREPGGVTGAMYLSAVVTEIFAAGLAVAMFLLTDWGTLTGLALAIPVFLVFSYWFLPRAIGLWTAVEYMVDHSHGDSGIEPRA